MFKRLRTDLLRALESLAREGGAGDASTMPAYVAEILVYRGLITQDLDGRLVLTGAGRRALQEQREGAGSKPE